MKVILAMLLLTTAPAVVAFELIEGVSVRFLSGKESGEFLAQPDDFIKSLSPFDRSVRLRVAREVSEKELLAHVTKHGLDWSGAEKKQLTAKMNEVRPLLKGLKLPLPKEILLIKTTGKEDAGAAYTRRNGIVFSENRLKRGGVAMRNLFLHELFHVMSRYDPKLATRLYRIIGYVPSPELKFPKELASRKLTNPDAPFSRHAIEFDHNGESIKAMPILYSRVAKYEEKQGGTLFRYLVFLWRVLDPKEPSLPARDEAGKLVLLRPDDAKGFHKKIGRNTGYIIHPEETMADNFVYMVTGHKNLPNPEIVKRVREVLSGEAE